MTTSRPDYGLKTGDRCAHRQHGAGTITETRAQEAPHATAAAVQFDAPVITSTGTHKSLWVPLADLTPTPDAAPTPEGEAGAADSGRAGSPSAFSGRLSE